eukprot:14187831-Alexandrium_andersonii.AAC.1
MPAGVVGGRRRATTINRMARGAALKNAPDLSNGRLLTRRSCSGSRSCRPSNTRRLRFRPVVSARL